MVCYSRPKRYSLRAAVLSDQNGLRWIALVNWLTCNGFSSNFLEFFGRIPFEVRKEFVVILLERTEARRSGLRSRSRNRKLGRNASRIRLASRAPRPRRARAAHRRWLVLEDYFRAAM